MINVCSVLPGPEYEHNTASQHRNTAWYVVEQLTGAVLETRGVRRGCQGIGYGL